MLRDAHRIAAAHRGQARCPSVTKTISSSTTGAITSRKGSALTAGRTALTVAPPRSATTSTGPGCPPRHMCSARSDQRHRPCRHRSRSGSGCHANRTRRSRPGRRRRHRRIQVIPIVRLSGHDQILPYSRSKPEVMRQLDSECYITRPYFQGQSTKYTAQGDLGSVDNHLAAMSIAQRCQLAAQLVSVLSYRVAIPLNSLIFAK